MKVPPNVILLITGIYFTMHLDASETKLNVGVIEHTILGLQVLHLHFDPL